jgi:hypothetical protein
MMRVRFKVMKNRNEKISLEFSGAQLALLHRLVFAHSSTAMVDYVTVLSPLLLDEKTLGTSNRELRTQLEKILRPHDPNKVTRPKRAPRLLQDHKRRPSQTVGGRHARVANASAGEFRAARYREIARRQPVVVTSKGHDEIVLISAEEHRLLKRCPRRVLSIEAPAPSSLSQ